jgi:hypothetical protein
MESRCRWWVLGAGLVLLACAMRAHGLADQIAPYAAALDSMHDMMCEKYGSFIHRCRTPVHPPSWGNEGMAEWIARALVPASQSVTQRELRALEVMRQTGSMGGGFLTREGNLECWQYGIASSLMNFLIQRNSQAYARFIQGKEGLTWRACGSTMV